MGITVWHQDSPAASVNHQPVSKPLCVAVKPCHPVEGRTSEHIRLMKQITGFAGWLWFFPHLKVRAMGQKQNSCVSLEDMLGWMLADTTARSQVLWWNDGLHVHISPTLHELQYRSDGLSFCVKLTKIRCRSRAGAVFLCSEYYLHCAWNQRCSFRQNKSVILG